MIVHRVNSDEVRIDAPAKLNLFLEVLNRRPDGFHNINSLFQAVSLFDRLTFQRRERPGCILTIAGANGLDSGPANLVCRAYDLMRNRFGFEAGLHVRLEKNIPVAAGLAGGSSNAAATLLACNLLGDLGLNDEALRRTGLELGSDIPFFFTRGQALVRGRGEILEETDYPTDYSVTLANPGFELSTAAAYAALKRDLTQSADPFSLPCCRAVEEFVHFLGLAGNDFERVHLTVHPELREIRDGLLQRGAALARMSGSGPTIFGIFTGSPYPLVKESKRWGHWRMDTVAPITLQTQATNVWRHRGNHRNKGDVT